MQQTAFRNPTQGSITGSSNRFSRYGAVGIEDFRNVGIAIRDQLGVSQHYVVENGLVIQLISGNPTRKSAPNLKSQMENNNLKIDSLEKLYKFRDREVVRSHLSSNKTLVSMISTIYTKIRKEFPSESIFLEVVSDLPHSTEKDIIISISTPLSVDEAIERLDKVESVRWSKESRDPRVDICLKLEYQ
jgi:hypothetical protein